jgi:hypothetical protein
VASASSASVSNVAKADQLTQPSPLAQGHPAATIYRSRSRICWHSRASARHPSEFGGIEAGVVGAGCSPITRRLSPGSSCGTLDMTIHRAHSRYRCPCSFRSSTIGKSPMRDEYKPITRSCASPPFGRARPNNWPGLTRLTMRAGRRTLVGLWGGPRSSSRSFSSARLR